MIRILGGEFRSRILRTPEGSEVTRPMAARVKESVFNLLRGWCEDAVVLDLYAGVGAIGLEAVSRGARRVLMVEQNRAIYRMLKENIEMLGCGDRAEAMQGDALSMLPLTKLGEPPHLMFLDPPYERMRRDVTRIAILEHIAAVRVHLARQSFVVLRTPELESAIDMNIAGYDGPEVHNYGNDMQVRLYMPAAHVNDTAATG